MTITEFVFHCVNLCGAGEVSMCIFCTWCRNSGGENSVSGFFSRDGGSD